MDGITCERAKACYRFAPIQVFTGAVPFGDLPSVRAMVAINQGERPPRPKHPYVTGSLWRLIRRCWDQLPSSRPETSEVAKVLNSSVSHSFRRSVS